MKMSPEISMLRLFAKIAIETAKELESVESAETTPAPKAEKTKAKKAEKETPAPAQTETEIDVTETTEEIAPEASDVDIFGDEPTTTEAPALTVEDVKTALRKVATKFGDKGKEKAVEILKAFKVKNVPELKESDFAAFIAKCEKVAK